MYWEILDLNWGGFDIRGRCNNRGKDYVCANVYVCGYGYGASREHQRPQRGRKRAPIVLMMLPYVARARYGSIINTIGVPFLPNGGLLPATVKSNATCIIHMI